MCLEDDKALSCLLPCTNAIAVNCHFGNGLICDIVAGDSYTERCNKTCGAELISGGDPCFCGEELNCGITEDSYCVGIECKIACTDSVLSK